MSSIKVGILGNSANDGVETLVSGERVVVVAGVEGVDPLSEVAPEDTPIIRKIRGITICTISLAFIG